MRSKVIIKLIIIFLVIIIMCPNIIFAGTVDTNVTISNRLMNEATDIGNRLIGGIFVIGTFVSVITLMVVGIKYMMCSVEEKAEYKKTAQAYIIGAILLFASTGIVQTIYKILQ